MKDNEGPNGRCLDIFELHSTVQFLLSQDCAFAAGSIAGAPLRVSWCAEGAVVELVVASPGDVGRL